MNYDNAVVAIAAAVLAQTVLSFFFASIGGSSAVRRLAMSQPLIMLALLGMEQPRVLGMRMSGVLMATMFGLFVADALASKEDKLVDDCVNATYVMLSALVVIMLMPPGMSNIFREALSITASIAVGGVGAMLSLKALKNAPRVIRKAVALLVAHLFLVPVVLYFNIQTEVLPAVFLRTIVSLLVATATLFGLWNSSRVDTATIVKILKRPEATT